MIEDMEQNLISEIENEAKEREENHDSFVALLEETCNKLERTISDTR